MTSRSRIRLENHRGHTILAFEPGSAPLVVDGGAHRGEFSTSVHSAWGARCHAIEASPALFAELDVPGTTVVHHFAVGGEDGTAQFSLSENAEASTLLGEAHAAVEMVTVPVRSLGSFLAEVAPDGLDLLKLDIEGAEIDALSSVDDTQLRRIGQITVEFHDFCGYVSREQVDQAILRLAKVGFTPFNFAFRTRGDMLFVNSRTRALSRWDKFRIGVVHRIRWRLTGRFA